jgi:hypothetical protein
MSTPKKKRTVNVAKHPIHQSARLALPEALRGVSTREYVYQCIAAAAPGAAFDDDSILSTIPVLGDDVGVCLNYRIPLTGPNAWKASEIKGSWSVGTLIARTDYRRSH